MTESFTLCMINKSKDTICTRNLS